MEALLAQDNDRRIGVLVVQLGTPGCAHPGCASSILRAVLGDPRVVERNRLLWWFILRLLVLPRRPRRSAALYQRIWSRNGSPLLVISQSQARALEAELNRHEPERVKSCWACATAVRQSRWLCRSCMPGERTGCCCFRSTRSTPGPTTGSTYDEVFKQLLMLQLACRHSGSSTVLLGHASYIESLAESVREAMAPLRRPPDKIIISFHGIPQRFVDSGNPYESRCEATARALAAKAGWEQGHLPAVLSMAHSREPWLQSEHGRNPRRTGTDRRSPCHGDLSGLRCRLPGDDRRNRARRGLQQFRAAGGETLQARAGAQQSAASLDCRDGRDRARAAPGLAVSVIREMQPGHCKDRVRAARSERELRCAAGPRHRGGAV